MRILLPFISAALGLSACNEAQPDGYRAAPEAIAEAEQFRKLAEQCQMSAAVVSRPDSACVQAISLYEKLSATPTNFDGESDWKRFSEAYQGGTNLMLKGFLKNVCLGEGAKTLSEWVKEICAASTAAKVKAWKEIRS